MKRIGYILLSSLMVVLLLAPVAAQDEGTTSALAGYTAGLNLGYPIMAGETYESGTGPLVGVVGNTPYGFALGPFNIGVGFGIEALFAEIGTQVGVYGSINTTLYVTPYGPLSYYGGVGYYDGLGIIGGVTFDYMVPNMPLVVKPYLRGVLNTGGGPEGKDLTYFANIGVMALYDISTLF